MATRVEQLIEEIKTLSPEEQQRLRAGIADVTQLRAAVDESSAEDQFKQRLLELGIIKEIKCPPRDFQKAQEEFMKYQPIRIKGKPISETIIEERR